MDAYSISYYYCYYYYYYFLARVISVSFISCIPECFFCQEFNVKIGWNKYRDFCLSFLGSSLTNSSPRLAISLLELFAFLSLSYF